MKLYTSPGVLAQMLAAISDMESRGDKPSHFVITPEEGCELGGVKSAYLSYGELDRIASPRYFKDHLHRGVAGFHPMGRLKGVPIYVVEPTRYEVP